MKKKLLLLTIITMHFTVSHAQWVLTGNAIAAGNFLGTTNTQPLVIKVNSTLSGLIDYLSTKAGTSFGFQTLAVNTGSNNTAMGYQALSSNTTGSNNTAYGALALPISTTGSNNTGIGIWALNANTTGQGNSGFGLGALFRNTTGIYNTACGFAGLDNNTTGNNNVALGMEPLFNNTTGFSNVAAGVNALYNNVSGSNLVAIGDSTLFNQNGGDGFNTALGSKALFTSTSGAYNTATGSMSMLATTSGTDNVADGYRALYFNNTGYDNTAVGYQALLSNSTGEENVGVGKSAGNGITTAFDNTALGVQALYVTSTGNCNTATGFESLFTNGTGSNNTALGCVADVNGSNYTNTTMIGYGATGTASNQVRIGNSFVTSIGGYANWSNISDGRFKKNIKENVPGLEFINQLRPVTYNLDITGINTFLRPSPAKDNNGKPTSSSSEEAVAIKQKEQMVHTGFIAQEVEAVAKKMGYDFSGVDAAKSDKDLYSLRYSDFVVPLVKGVQQLSLANDSLKATNDSLVNVVSSLQSQIDDIKQQINSLRTGAGFGGFGDAPILKQNSPNPFNNNTLIGYYLPSSTGNAQLLITDLNGRNLKTIALNNKGTGQVTIAGGSLASGTYIYSLISDGKLVDSKKMVLTK